MLIRVAVKSVCVIAEIALAVILSGKKTWRLVSHI